ncbi:MAG: hypothetical protein OXC68_12830 [Aestuariivita sp.]|nr:hypothetical protein [Aestuariivita sp.]
MRDDLHQAHPQVRPIRHHLNQRVWVHIFICMRNHLVEWHMCKALVAIPHTETEPDETQTPVLSAKRSEADGGRETVFEVATRLDAEAGSLHLLSRFPQIPKSR